MVMKSISRCLAILLLVWTTSLQCFRLQTLQTRKRNAMIVSQKMHIEDFANTMNFAGSVWQSLILADQQDADLEKLAAAISQIDSLSIGDLQNIAIGIAGFGYLIYEGRPKGSCRDDLVEVTRSKHIPNNLGVVATRFIPKDTTIGYYPGYLRKYSSAIKSKSSEEAKKNAKRYFWAVDEENVLDPTNDNGAVEVELVYIGGLFKSSTTLSRVNEPCSGYDCNLYTKISPSTGLVQVIAERDIFAGEELFIDYGNNYDRSDYISTFVKKDDYEVEKDVVIEPVLDDGSITINPSKPKSSKKKDSFLDKLAEKDEEYRKRGIIAPDEMAKMFEDRGSTIFDSAENQEYIDSILGNTSLNKILGKEEEEEVSTPTSAFSRRPQDKEMDEAEFEALVKSASKGLPVNSDELTAGNPFRELLNIKPAEMKASVKKEAKKDEKSSKGEPTKPSSPTATSFASALKGPGKPNISPEEADRIQKLMDNMSDEEIEKAFKEMTKIAAERYQEKLVKDFKEKQPQSALPPLQKPPVKDSQVRKQYKEEFDEIEKVLEKMYSDPLAVWQDLMKDPEKYLEDPKTKE